MAPPTDPDGNAAKQQELKNLRKIRGFRRTAASKEITALETLLDSAIDVVLQVDVIKARLKLLTDLQATLKDMDEKILDLLIDEEDEVGQEEMEDSLQRQRLIEVILNKAERLLYNPNEDVTSQKSNGSQAANSAVNSVHSNQFNITASKGNTKLPKLELPTFSGDMLNFQSFWEMFEASIHKKDNIDDIEKFQYLRSVLKGDALKKIENLTITSDNYATAVQNLLDEYQQPSKIIECHINKLLNMKAPSYDYKSLSGFNSDMKSHLAALANYKIDTSCEGCSTLLGNIIANKLPDGFRTRLQHKKLKETWTLPFIKEALSNVLLVLVDKADKEQPNRHTESNKSQTNRTPKSQGNTQRKFSRPHNTMTINQGHNNNANNNSKTKPTPFCAYCKANHWHQNCTVYSTVNERRQRARAMELCIGCLSTRHKTEECPSTYLCRRCNDKHHQTLCNKSREENRTDNNVSQAPAALSEAANVNLSSISTLSTKAIGKGVALPTAQITIDTGRDKIQTRVIFDSCSQISLASREFAESLGLVPVRSIYTSINGINTSTSKQRYEVVRFDIMISAEIIPLEAVLVNSLPNEIYVPGLDRTAASLRRLHVHLADPYVGDIIRGVTILIGADQYSLFSDGQIQRINDTNLINTRFGKMIWGPLPYVGDVCVTHTNIATVLRIGVDTYNVSLDANVEVNHDSKEDMEYTKQQDLDLIWRLDAIGISTNEMSSADRQAIQDFENYLIYKDNQYIARLLWKPDHPTLPDNYGIAKACLYSNIRKLMKTPHLLECYNRIINEQMERKFIEEVTPSTPIHHESKVHYLPHHGVSKQSNTTPLRIVYNCSAGKISLNDCLYSGPSYVMDLSSLLLRFRINPWATVSDIEKAFLKIGLAEQDRDSTRFLWLEDPNDLNSRLITFRFRVVLFGSTCSQFILNAAVKHHLEHSSSTFAHKMLSDLYIDNLISTFQTEEEIGNYYHQANHIMNTASLNLREWTSNSREARNLFEENNNHTQEKIIKVLGVEWNVDNDIIGYPTKQKNKTAKTKREILSITAALFDPLGHLAPISIRAKTFLQRLWKTQCTWDQELDSELQIEWTKIAEDLTHAQSFKLPRQLIFDTDVILHIFGDASQKSYGVVAYIVSNNISNIIIAKAKVAPMKELTIPKLELTAATLAARMSLFLHDTYNELKINETHLWSDSQVTLQWIHSKQPQNQYVQNRIDEIHKTSPKGVWHYVQTTENPADLLSRGMTAKKFLTSKLWIHGPDWLINKSDWPKWEISNQRKNETTCIALVDEPLQNNKPLMDLTNYSKYQTLLKITAMINRFLHNLRNPSNRNLTVVIDARKGILNHNLSVEEMNTAETYWIIFAQRTVYPEEYNILKRRDATKNDRILSLNLFLADGLIRCKRRLDNSDLAFDVKYPILLPPKHHLTTLIVRYYHLTSHHINVSQLMLLLQQRYHIPQMRQSIKKIIRPCVLCKRMQGVSYRAPPVPPLPSERVTKSRPFSRIGLDYTGAINIRNQRKGTRKVYIALFSCFTTRAIHLEVVDDNSKDSFLLALRRFVARRGIPSYILSDNATTFASSANYLKTMQSLPSVNQYLLNHRITWKFIASRSPHLGAVYERLIGVVKSCLRKTLGNALVTRSEIDTIVTEVECCVNSRPLTHVDDDLTCDKVITPSRLIYGFNIYSIPVPSEYLNKDEDYGTKSAITKRYKYVLSLLESIWKNWSISYLTSLRQHEISTGNPKMKIGDIVLIYEDCSRLKWKLGRITNLRSGSDGYVRSVDLETATGQTSRSVIKLYPLEISSSVEQELVDTSSTTINRDTSEASASIRPTRVAKTRANLKFAKQL